MPYVNHADLGGVSGFGAVIANEGNEPFHGDWEARVLALTVAMGATGSWNLDMSRSARETLPQYRQLSYYEIWLAALEKMVFAKGLVQQEELAAGRRLKPSGAIRGLQALRADQVLTVLANGVPTAREPVTEARFRCGERVHTRREAASHHTRLPGYLRGKTGVIERVHGAHVFADDNAQGKGENPEWLYTVAFDATELWGPGADAGHRVSFEAWQPYLERA
jgi:nitrile hydratase subunit beta